MNKIFREFIIIGHRGTIGVHDIGENTLASMDQGLRDGAEGIEFDVYVVKDAANTPRVVVIHDDDVDRTTNGHGKVIDMSFEQIAELDAGQGEKVPTIEEVIELVEIFNQQNNIRRFVNVELKGPGTAEPVAEFITGLLKSDRRYTWQVNDFVVSSFDHKQLADFHDLLPEIPIAVLIDENQWESYGRSTEPVLAIAKQLDAIAINPGLSFLSKELVEALHANGLKVYVWTGSTLDDVLAIRDSGADGVFANNPLEARTVCD